MSVSFFFVLCVLLSFWFCCTKAASPAASRSRRPCGRSDSPCPRELPRRSRFVPEPSRHPLRRGRAYRTVAPPKLRGTLTAAKSRWDRAKGKVMGRAERARFPRSTAALMKHPAIEVPRYRKGRNPLPLLPPPPPPTPPAKNQSRSVRTG